MLLSLALFASIAYAEQSNYTKMGIHPVRNIMSSVLFFTGFVIFMLAHWLIADNGAFVKMLSNPLFWIVVLMDVPTAFIKRKNYEYNYRSLTSIGGAMQLSFVFLPLISWLISDVMKISSPVPSLFKSSQDAALYSLGISIYLVFYLRRKIELNHVTSLFYLILTPLWMSFTMYGGVVLMQVESPAAPFIVVSFINCLLFMVLAIKHGEFSIIERQHRKEIGWEVLKSIPSRPVVLYLGSTLAAEIFVVLKRISQLVVAMVMDGFSREKLRGNLHDIAFVIFVLGFTSYWAFAHA